MERKIKYPRCGKKTRQNKHGNSKAGSQRYLRKHCNKTYVTMPKIDWFSWILSQTALCHDLGNIYM